MKRESSPVIWDGKKGYFEQMFIGGTFSGKELPHFASLLQTWIFLRWRKKRANSQFSKLISLYPSMPFRFRSEASSHWENRLASLATTRRKRRVSANAFIAVAPWRTMSDFSRTAAGFYSHRNWHTWRHCKQSM